MYFQFDRAEQIVSDVKSSKMVFKGKLVSDANSRGLIVLHQEPFVTGSFSNLLPVAVCRTQLCNYDDYDDYDLKILTNKNLHIVKYYGWNKDCDFHYKIEELCECSIYNILKGQSNKTVYFDDILNSLSNNDVLKQSLSGLSFIHGLGLYHGNIQPENFLISKTDQNKFVVKLNGFKQKLYDTTQTSTTSMNEGWVAPEVYEIHDQKTDAFMFGCFIFFLFTGNHPFGCNVLNQRCGIRNKDYDVYKKSWVPLTIDDVCVSFNQEISEFELDKTNILIKELVVFSREDRKKINEISLM